MPIRTIMNPGTINTLLNTAPVVLQGANKLITLIRERRDQTAGVDAGTPSTVESLHQELQQIEKRLNANDESDVEQVQLIEHLARQNEALVESLRRMHRYILLLTGLMLLALLASLVSLILQALG